MLAPGLGLPEQLTGSDAVLRRLAQGANERAMFSVYLGGEVRKRCRLHPLQRTFAHG
jgi:hypothetical protein